MGTRGVTSATRCVLALCLLLTYLSGKYIVNVFTFQLGESRHLCTVCYNRYRNKESPAVPETLA